MKEVDIGITLDDEGLNFFGFEEVNDLLKQGLSVQEIAPARLLVSEYHDEDGEERNVLTGYVYKIILQAGNTVS